MPHAVITGASRRLGLYLTEQLLKDQWQVTVLTRHTSRELASLDQKNLTIIETDYQPNDALHSALQPLLRSSIDLLFHNASKFEPDADSEIDSHQQLLELMNIHVALPAFLNRVLAPALKMSTNANVIAMTDIYVDNPAERFSNYCASKAALENLSRSFAKQWGDRVRVNTIQPGALKFLPEHSEYMKKAVLEKSLIQREAGFEPIYQALCYLVENRFITGTALRVDGGRWLAR